MLPLGLAVLMAALDRATTWEVSLFVFYAVPIVLAVWWVGSLSGYAMAFVCGFLWWVSNYHANPYETTIGYLWATMSRVIFFCVTVFAVTAVRNRQEADADRIEALEERRQLEMDLVSVSEYEQQRIGQDLHDGLCQHLAAIGQRERERRGADRTVHPLGRGGGAWSRPGHFPRPRGPAWIGGGAFRNGEHNRTAHRAEH
jgi:signal transduction histidine kinase